MHVADNASTIYNIYLITNFLQLRAAAAHLFAAYIQPPLVARWAHYIYTLTTNGHAIIIQHCNVRPRIITLNHFLSAHDDDDVLVISIIFICAERPPSKIMRSGARVIKMNAANFFFIHTLHTTRHELKNSYTMRWLKSIALRVFHWCTHMRMHLLNILIGSHKLCIHRKLREALRYIFSAHHVCAHSWKYK